MPKVTNETKEVAVVNETKTVAVKQDNQSWGTSAIEASDIIIPRLFTLNSNSKMCVENPKQYSAGSIVRSIDKKVIEGDIQFIPFMFIKKWKIEKKGKSRFEHVRFEPHTAQNAQRPWSWVEDGVEMRANVTLDFFVLIKEDIEREARAIKALEESGEIPDTDDVMLPTVISFSRTSYAEGKILLTHFSKAESFKLNPAVSTFSLKSVLRKGDDNSWYTLAVEKAGKSDQAHVEAARKWYNILNKSGFQVDEHSEDDSSPSEQPQATHDFSTDF